MIQESKKIKKSKRKPKNKTEQSKVVYCKIFSFLSTKDRLQCRFVSRSFNYFVIQSIESLNFEAMNSKMKSFKQFIVKCTNLKYLIYPCLYKRVQMTSLVGKKRRPQIREISHITFTNYEQIAQLVTVNPGLRTLELNYDYHNGPVVLGEPLKDVFLNSMVEEIIIKREDFSDMQLVVLMKDKITSLRILLHSDSNQLLEKLISLELNLKKLYLKLKLFDERTEENLNFFLSHQSNLEVLYLDCHKAMDLTNHKKLQTLILENIEEIKAIKFPQQPINKVIIKSLYITHKDIKFLMKNFSQFNILDISSVQGCWFDILLAKNKCIIPAQAKKKRMNVYLNKNTFAKLDEIAKNAEVQLFQLEPIENLLNYYQ